MMANSFHAFINLENYMGWIELFGLEETEPIYQKRILSIVSGAILPLVALGFIKSLVDYIRPEQSEETIPAVVEEQLEEDLYSRDAEEAKTQVEVGEVHIAPETVNHTDDAVADIVEKPTLATHITPVGDPIVIPTTEAQLPPRIIKPPLTARPFNRGVNSKP